MSEQLAEFDDRVAVVGIAFRGPGAPDFDTYIDNVLAGRESIEDLDPDFLHKMGVPEEQASDPRYIARRPLLDDVWGIDQEFFGLTDREAAVRNPQHRLFLELCATALQDANLVPARLRGKIGVYGGSSWDEYLDRHVRADPKIMRLVGEAGARLANSRDYLTTWVSYSLDLRGPSMSINTACSTGLVAVHMASQALRSGDCDIALAGAVSIEMPYGQGYKPTPGGIDSLDGHCRPFDRNASGTIFGSGGGILVLKLLTDAIEDGNHIHGILSGSAVNNDGSQKSTFTSPNPAAQRDVIVEAMAAAEVEPESVSYIELHATATRVGDPVEVDALARAYAGVPAESVTIGSVKANIGHLGSASGIAGLIKVLGCIQRRILPPTINVKEVNPSLHLGQSPFRLAMDAEPWPSTSVPRRGAVSAFGFGGTNAHIIVEEPPSAIHPPTLSDQPVLIAWSAPTEGLVDEFGARIADAVIVGSLSPRDVAFTLAIARPLRGVRRYAVVSDVSEMLSVLRGAPWSVLPENADPATRALAAAGAAWQADDSHPLDAATIAPMGRLVRLPTAPWNRQAAYVPPPPLTAATARN